MQALQAQRRQGAQRVVGRGRLATQQQGVSLRGGTGISEAAAAAGPSCQHPGARDLRSGFEESLPQGCHNADKVMAQPGSSGSGVSGGRKC